MPRSLTIIVILHAFRLSQAEWLMISTSKIQLNPAMGSVILVQLLYTNPTPPSGSLHCTASLRYTPTHTASDSNLLSSCLHRLSNNCILRSSFGGAAVFCYSSFKRALVGCILYHVTERHCVIRLATDVSSRVTCPTAAYMCLGRPVLRSISCYLCASSTKEQISW